MNSLIFYFSGTGNTWWASKQLAADMKTLGHTVELFSLENPALERDEFVKAKIAAAKLVIVGYPVYGSDLPRNMRDFIAGLPRVSDGKRFGAFCTQAAFSGDGSVFFKQTVERKGYNFRQSFQINLTTNFNVAMPPFCFSRPAAGAKLEKIKREAAAKIKVMAAEFANDQKHIEGEKLYQVLLGGLQRNFFRRGEKRLLKKFQFFKDRCVSCGLCAETCPTGNISLDTENMILKRGGDCLLCFRCYNFCPGLAINYGNKVKDPGKYQRYTGPVEGMKLSDIRE